MNHDEIRKHLKLVEREVEGVLQHYVEHSGCPCSYERFIYWAGKEQGPGWQDNIQNRLVKSALKLECYEKTELEVNEWGYQGSYLCRNCGAMWMRYSMEWRMLAFHEQLLREGGPEPEELYSGLIGSDVAATVGHEPDNRPSLSLQEWVNFMLDGNKHG